MKTDKYDLINYIIDITAQYNNISVKELKKKTRIRYIVDARHMAGYLIFKHVKGISMREVAGHVNVTNPATILNGNKKITGYLTYDEEVSSQLEFLENKIDIYIFGNSKGFSDKEKLDFVSVGLQLHNIEIKDEVLIKIIPVIELILRGEGRTDLIRLKNVKYLEI